MKTRFLFALFLVAPLVLFSQCPGSPPAGITCIPDSNFETQLVNLGIDSDGLVNGQVSTADISDETSLVIPIKGIADLSGIEDFASLQTLNVWGNPLGTLDVSSNTNLTSLICYNCQLTSLTLPSSTSLTMIECFNNFLTDLDVSGVTNLTTLNCHSQTDMGNPGYGTIDLQNNIMLSTFNCWDAGLNNLNLNNNSALAALRVEENNLSTLDISNNNLLQIVSVNFNPLTEIDASATTQLWSFSATWCGLQNINIKNGNNNLITSLDVTNNPMGLCIQVDVVPPVNQASWNKDASADYMTSCPGLSVNSSTIRSVKLFPNPSKHIISFESEKSGDYFVYSIKGQLINSGVFNTGFNSINTSSLSTGTYVLKLRSENEVATKRILKTF